MSHLPLDARAILQHLNELGYRNISAEQLREFLKEGMQPQSDKQSASRLATSTRNPTAVSAAASATAATPPKVKVIKSKRPLCHFKFYLDICDHQLGKRIETDIKALGGHLEFFLSDSITHFITDKPEVSGGNGNGNQPQPGRTPGTPGTPNTPTSHFQDDVRKPNQRQSRADAILSRARRSTVGVVSTGGNSGASNNNSTPTTTSLKRSYTIWQTDQAQRFIKRIQTELKQYLEGKKEGSGGGGAAGSPHHIQLKKQYVKIESVKRNYRPYYHLIKQPEDWPKIDLSSEDGAFRLLTKSKKEKDKELEQIMTRKSQGSRTSQKDKDKEKVPQHPAIKLVKKESVIPNSPRSNCRELKDSSEKQGGVCEICKLEYDTLNIHLQSKDHELFAKNAENFLALDTLISSSADVNRFLEEEPFESELEMDVDESLSNEEQKRPSPALREKSKRVNKGKHSSEKFQAASPQTPSPGKKLPGNLPGSLTELQRQEHPTTAAATPTTGNSGRRKTQNSGLSPPIRAMLPPSSLYKVVETREECATPPRRGRHGANQVDSPSLIVKFQKVRQTELQRLNGEAENFMFPRTTISTTRSSSELPTDVDRQTTSDVRGRYSISSASLDTSTSEAETKDNSGLVSSNISKRAQAVGRRRKVGAGGGEGQDLLQRQLSTGSSSSNSNQNQSQSQQQRFPSAPIQPEEEPQPEEPQLKMQLKMKMQVKLKQVQVVKEEQVATRKSSRTATAIVTAATASSRHQQQQLRQTSRRMAIKLEDRMGESPKSKTKLKKEQEQEELKKFEEVLMDELEEELELESSLSSATSDEDYIARRSTTTATTINTISPPTRNSLDTREQRAARRLSRLTINRSPSETKSTSSPSRRVPKNATSPPKAKGKPAKIVPPAMDLFFDCNKSESLKKMHYTFETLPSGELWNRVFVRQDAGEENYYTYYGSTRYRKLPYEMGPIPMARTLPAHTCSLCKNDKQEGAEEVQQREQKPLKKEKEEAQSSSCSSSIYKHKKLHLLQRYQQEQEQLHQKQEQLQQLEGISTLAKCDSKASTPELLEREFASGSLGDRVQLIERVRSTSSSSCSNSQRSGITCRNKQLARIAELPPRKSPREHASTLALVSCIIRQRQDSQSKTNSEAEAEPPPNPPPPPVVVMPKLKTPLKQEPASPRTTRSQAATPVEELRFATEISETVKRMRRGQNKYDHSPPAPGGATVSSPARSRRLPQPTNQNLTHSYSRRLEFASTSRKEISSRRGRGNAGPGRPPQSQQPSGAGAFRGVRKLPSKKGILEYEMEPCAFKVLDQARQWTNPGFAAWQLDKYLELVNREYDMDLDELPALELEDSRERLTNPTTPPPTDCFTSEFDLCDLIQGSGGSGDDEEDSGKGNQPCFSRRMNNLNLYTGYYRKRKTLKSNRTGWPKAQRRRNAGGLGANRSLPEERINFQKMGLGEMHPIKQEPLEMEEEQTTTTTTTTSSTLVKRAKLLSKEDDDDGGAGGESPEGEEESGRGAAVMTPPATDVDETADNELEPEAEPDENESLPEEDETVADSVDQDQQDDEAEIEATDADVEEEEEEDDDEEEEGVFEDAFEEQELGKQKEEPPEKRARIPSISVSTPQEGRTSPGKKLLLTLHNGQRLQATSTPSSGQGQQRRTPQLNGSLGSCISPSEKLGDNSDIFTVSSDGLDTDLDLSNTQAGDSLEHCPHQQTTPKRKFDISKYAPPNNGKPASSCAAEAATAAVKSLAISQFLKKEVRVTCRRLRAPFRRFRYRR